MTKTKTEQVYDWIVDNHKPGERFTSTDLCASMGLEQGPVSGALFRLEHEGVVGVIGAVKSKSFGRKYVYEYLSHEPVKFNRPGCNGGKPGRSSLMVHTRDIPIIEEIYAPPEIKGVLEISKPKPFLPSDLKSLSERLLDLAVEVAELERKVETAR